MKNNYKVYLTTLGTTKYRDSKYYINNDGFDVNSPDYHFGTIHYISNTCGDSNNKLYCFVTKEIIDSSSITPDQKEYGTLEREETPNNYEYLKKELLDGTNIFKEEDINYILIDYDFSGIQLYSSIRDNILNKYKDDQIDLYVDITNSYRSIPLTMFPALRMIENFHHNVNLVSLFYWQERTNDNINKYYSGTELLYTYNNILVAEEIGYFIDTFHIQSTFGSQIEYEKGSLIPELKEQLKKFENDLEYVNIKECRKDINDLLNKIRELKESDEFRNNIAVQPYIEQLENTFNQIHNNDNFVFDMNIARQLIDKNQLQIAATFLEAIFYNIFVEAACKMEPDIDYEKVSDDIAYKVSQYAKVKFFQNRNKSGKDGSSNRYAYKLESRIDELFNSCGRLSFMKTTNNNKVNRVVNNYFNNVRNPMNHGHGETNKISKIDNHVNEFIEALEIINREVNKHI